MTLFGKSADQILEMISACHKIGESVEAGAGGGEQNDVALLCHTVRRHDGAVKIGLGDDG